MNIRPVNSPGRAAYPPFLAKGEGLCATVEPGKRDDFTNESRQLAGRAARDRARAVCDACPFRRECFEWAYETEQEGMYGSTSTEQRANMRKNVWAEREFRLIYGLTEGVLSNAA